MSRLRKTRCSIARCALCPWTEMFFGVDVFELRLRAVLEEIYHRNDGAPMNVFPSFAVQFPGRNAKGDDRMNTEGKPEVGRIKEHLDNEILLGCARLLAAYREALAEAGGTRKYVHGHSEPIARILARIAKQSAPEDRRWKIANEIVDHLPGGGDLDKAVEMRAAVIVQEIDSKFAREIDENIDALRKPVV